jgi:S-DNA-T family DNA segregation ATPase FtsK/SpoIIIE
LSKPLPEKIVILLQEAQWFAIALAAFYLAMILYGYTPSDPGWSHAVVQGDVHNPGG